MARLIGLLFFAACALAVAVVIGTALQPIDWIYRHLVIDDAIYYLQPARNLVAGRGYSFDGVYRTNGVQPLWALVVVGFAALLREPEAIVRAMVAVSGLCWVLAGGLLWRILRPLHAVGALLAGLLWLMAGLEGKYALWGMENGLQGALLALCLLQALRVARTPLDAPGRGRRVFAFGLAAALVACTRIECGLLVVLLGIWLCAIGRGGGLRASTRRALPFLLPVLLLGAVCLVGSKLYFDEWTPVSGTVKVWAAGRGPLPTPLVARLLDGAQLVLQRAFAGVLLPLVEGLVVLLRRAPSAGEIALALATTLLPLLAGAHALWRRLLLRGASPTLGVALALAVFVGLHQALLAVLLPQFIAYCTWYLTVETLAICLLLGGLCGALAGWRRLCALPFGALVIAGCVRGWPGWHAPTPSWATSAYVDLGHFVERWLPTGATVGAFAAGYVSLGAPSHRVVNLDGLINDGRYLREYLMRERMPDYFRDEHIGYVADVMPVGQWQKFDRHLVNELPAALRPLWCGPAPGGWIACVLATEYGLPSLPKARPHPLGALIFAALVRGEHRIVPDAARSSVPPDQVIAATLLVPPTGDVVHVAVARDRLSGCVDPAGIAGLTAVDAQWQERVALRAVELPAEPVAPGQRCLITAYWQALPQIADGPPFAFALRLGEGERAATVTAKPAQGTLTPAQWPAGQWLAHSFAVAAPGDARGELPVSIAVVGDDGRPLPGAGTGTGAAGVRVGALRMAP
jgi:hypothetical protein